MQLPYSNLQMEHWNPGATRPLVLPVHLICNTSDDEIYGNIRKNSALKKKWIRVEEAHDNIAVLCGSGPSLADFIEDIKDKQKTGGKVFAMNGSAKFLNDNGIVPDYQVIIDAREQTASLIGPAKEHLFASQVHPLCFELVPDARLWHLQVGNIENEFPEYEDDYCLIGGAASVGNTATCLAYAMGFRNLHLYGYDSSHRNNNGHAFHQKMNDGDPTCSVKFNGKDYIASLTMKLQAERFTDTSEALISSGCKIEVFGDGLLPEMFRNPDKVKESISEQEKYKKMWSIDEYRDLSPGELCVDKFIEIAKPGRNESILDIGCGTGRASVKIHEATGCHIVLVDFADNCRDEEAKNYTFHLCDISKNISAKGDYGFCADVMEHIEPDKVAQVIDNIFNSCRSVFLQISTVPDNMGALIGQPLHLTVRPHEWWHKTFTDLGLIVKWEEKGEISSMFYIANSTT